ncbi:hypothetical protein BDZ97DRAFT_86807 [Flammula alnicola]|nr:hypothetical protein BDZ97DRAFT_86807 [Flammula alnicola]
MCTWGGGQQRKALHFMCVPLFSCVFVCSAFFLFSFLVSLFCSAWFCAFLAIIWVISRASSFFFAFFFAFCLRVFGLRIFAQQFAPCHALLDAFSFLSQCYSPHCSSFLGSRVSFSFTCLALFFLRCTPIYGWGCATVNRPMPETWR